MKLLKSHFLLGVCLLVLSTFPVKAQIGTNQSNYVKLEVRGTLLRQGMRYYVQTDISSFRDTKLRVMLWRTEDKNRLLDRHLEKLYQKTVVATGFIDCRRIGHEAGVIDIYLNNESQVAVVPISGNL